MSLYCRTLNRSFTNHNQSTTDCLKATHVETEKHLESNENRKGVAEMASENCSSVSQCQTETELGSEENECPALEVETKGLTDQLSKFDDLELCVTFANKCVS